jgi:hypothetical protein
MKNIRILRLLSFTRMVAVSAAGATAGLLAAAPAGAAPQMLVLLESGGRLPLQCEGTVCRAELATMCLQPERRMPEAGRRYRPLDGGEITVAGLDPAGRAVRIAVPASARIKALRGHLAVRLEIPAHWLRRHFASLQGVVVNDGAVLRPVAASDDAKPLTEAEILRAKGYAVTVASDAFAANPGSVLTARISNYLINALPAGKPVDDRALALAWHGALAELPGNAEHLPTARFIVDYCQYSANSGLAASLRSCLQGRQDRALEDVHQDFVDALATGS